MTPADQNPNAGNPPADPMKTPAVSPEILEQQLRPVTQALAQHLMVQFQPPRDPLADHITPEIVSQIIKAKEKRDERAESRKKFEAWFNPLVSLGSITLVLGFALAFVLVLLKWDKSEKIDLILGAILGYGAGVMTKFGVAKADGKKKEDAAE